MAELWFERRLSGSRACAFNCYIKLLWMFAVGTWLGEGTVKYATSFNGWKPGMLDALQWTGQTHPIPRSSQLSNVWLDIHEVKTCSPGPRTLSIPVQSSFLRGWGGSLHGFNVLNFPGITTRKTVWCFGKLCYTTTHGIWVANTIIHLYQFAFMATSII